jgi:DNA sulfur modification protein DndB
MTKIQTSEKNDRFNTLTLSKRCSLNLPSIRGIQAGKEFYAAMCPLRMVARMFVFDEEDLPVELRAQRVLNKARIPEISAYILRNPRDYVMSALTASIDGDAKFIPQSDDPDCYNIGWLNIPLSARILVNDGQHRRAAIQTALKACPDLGDESVPVIFFLDLGLKRSQQIFADLNRYALRPSMSLNVLYDHRDPWAHLALELVEGVPLFTGFTEKERTSLSNRSNKLFTLSGIYQATKELLLGNRNLSMTEKLNLAKDFWNEVSCYMPEWELARQGNLSGQELRKDYVSGHTIALVALGRAGAALLKDEPKDWKQRLTGLENMDWGRSNRQCWERRVMAGDKISNSRHHLVLVCNVVKQALGLRFNNDEEKAEAALFVNKGVEME